MEKSFTETIMQELDKEVLEKDKWLKNSAKLLSNLSKQIYNFADCSESIFYLDLFSSLEKLSKKILKLSAFILQFASSLLEIKDKFLVKQI